MTVSGAASSSLAPATFDDLRGAEPFTPSSPSSVLTSKQSPLSESFNFNPTLHHGLPTFDELSDLESEDDFVNGLVNLGGSSISETKRSRSDTCSTTVSLGQDPFFAEGAGDFDFEDTTCVATGLPSPLNTGSDPDSHQDKKLKKSKESRKAAPTMDVATDTPHPIKTEDESSSQQQQQPQHQQHNPSMDSSQDYSTAPPDSPFPEGTPTASGSNLPGQQSVPVRRGRKHSFSDDPTKPFKCDQCNHRFRRQEHLKRHYRSLHTQEKPFTCNECGKKFSRSDNLSQHARTHGTGHTVMGVMDPSEDGLDMMALQPHTPETQMEIFGKVLFQVASEVAGSSSGYSSEDSSSDVNDKKKRKRSD